MTARGIGIELRLHGCDPDAAVAAARARGYIVVADPADKPHGLREAYIGDPDGYMWVPDSKRLSALGVQLRSVLARGVGLVRKALVFGDHLRAQQQHERRDLEREQRDDRGRQRAVDEP